MRFSILSIILLTFWIALGVQTYIGRQRIAEVTEERKKSETRFVELRREIQNWKSLEVDQHVAESQSALAEIKDLDRALVKAFDEEKDALSELKVDDQKLSIRTMPRIARSQQTLQVVKVFLPESRAVALKVDVRPKEMPDAKPPDSSESGPKTDPVFDIKGDYPFVMNLKPGLHLIECLYSYHEEDGSPKFVTTVDGQEVSRLTCPDATSGYSSSQTNWFKQQDLPPDRPLPKLIDVTPGGSKTTISVRLVEAKS